VGGEQMQKIRIIDYWYFLFLAIIVFISCGRSPEKARVELAKMNIEFSEKSFFDKVLNNDIVAVKLLLDAGINVNAKDNYYGSTALIKAISKGNSEIAKLLIEKKANVNARSNYGWTALMEAVDKGDLEMAKLLIDKKADVNAKDRYGRTAMAIAKARNRQDIVSMLEAVTGKQE
jgi:ankyrin repeat protein